MGRAAANLASSPAPGNRDKPTPPRRRPRDALRLQLFRVTPPIEHHVDCTTLERTDLPAVWWGESVRGGAQRQVRCAMLVRKGGVRSRDAQRGGVGAARAGVPVRGLRRRCASTDIRRIGPGRCCSERDTNERCPEQPWPRLHTRPVNAQFARAMVAWSHRIRTVTFNGVRPLRTHRGRAFALGVFPNH